MFNFLQVVSVLRPGNRLKFEKDIDEDNIILRDFKSLAKRHGLQFKISQVDGKTQKFEATIVKS